MVKRAIRRSDGFVQRYNIKSVTDNYFKTFETTATGLIIWQKIPPEFKIPPPPPPEEQEFLLTARIDYNGARSNSTFRFNKQKKIKITPVDLDEEIEKFRQEVFSEIETYPHGDKIVLGVSDTEIEVE